MQNLDDVNAMKTLDAVNVLGSIEQLGDQSRQAWDEVQNVEFPETYKAALNIVFSGMGGSALGAYVTKSLFWDTLAVPFEIVNDYYMPPYVGEKTLAILSSYSGTTEETLAGAEAAASKKAMVTGITTGGKLGDFFLSQKYPVYRYVPRANPSNQPRLGSGYSVVGLVGMLSRLGYVTVEAYDIDEVTEQLKAGNAKYGVTVLEASNPAKKMAKAFSQKIPIIVSARHLLHVGRVMRNQLHESAKNFAAYHDVPELNHHLMEGLSNPTQNKELLKFVVLDSSLYDQKVQKRMTITKDVVAKQGIEVFSFQPTSKSRLSQVMECIQFGAYVNYYMAMMSDLDPSKIPWVDYFKAELSK